MERRWPRMERKPTWASNKGDCLKIWNPQSYGFVPQILYGFSQKIPSGLSCSFVKCLGISTSWRWLAASPTGPMDTQLDHFRLPIFRRSRSLGWRKLTFGSEGHFLGSEIIPVWYNMFCRSEVGTVWSILPVTQHTVNNPFFLMELYGIRPSTGHVQL